MPLTIGDSSPAVTASIASSINPRPSVTRPSLTSKMPCDCTARAKVRIAEALADLRSVGCDRGCGLVVTGGLVLKHERKQ